MTITDEALVRAAAQIDRSILRIRIVAWTLAIGWLCLLASLVAFGERDSSYGDLASGLRTGDISEVQVSSSDFADGSTGYETVHVRWRDDLVMRTATLGHASGERAAREARRGGVAPPVIVGSVADHLIGLDADIRISQGERRHASFTTYGWRVSGWLLLASLILLVGTLGLIAGPRPWRATRWAWAWLVLIAAPIGVPAYFLFGGSTGLFRPQPPARVWLTGGWAFLLAVLLGGASSN